MPGIIPQQNFLYSALPSNPNESGDYSYGTDLSEQSQLKEITERSLTSPILHRLVEAAAKTEGVRIGLSGKPLYSNMIAPAKNQHLGIAGGVIAIGGFIGFLTGAIGSTKNDHYMRDRDSDEEARFNYFGRMIIVSSIVMTLGIALSGAQVELNHEPDKLLPNLLKDVVVDNISSNDLPNFILERFNRLCEDSSPTKDINYASRGDKFRNEIQYLLPEIFRLDQTIHEEKKIDRIRQAVSNGASSFANSVSSAEQHFEGNTVSDVLKYIWIFSEKLMEGISEPTEADIEFSIRISKTVIERLYHAGVNNTVSYIELLNGLRSDLLYLEISKPELSTEIPGTVRTNFVELV